jgi:hypothetical protein
LLSRASGCSSVAGVLRPACWTSYTSERFPAGPRHSSFKNAIVVITPEREEALHRLALGRRNHRSGIRYRLGRQT